VTGFPGSRDNPGSTVESDCPIPIDVLEIDFVCTKLVSLDGVQFFETVEAVPGQTVYFRVKVDNPGEVDVKLTLRDQLDGSFFQLMTDDGDVCAFDGNLLECTFDLVAGTGTRTIDYRGRLRPSASPETLVNRVDLSVETGPPTNPGASREEPNACQAEVVVLEPSLICEKEISIDGERYFPSVDVESGQDVFFRVTITGGPAPLRNVMLTDMLPSECFENVVLISPAADCAAIGNTIECDFGDLEVDGELIIDYQATVVETPDINCVNTAEITADTGTEENPGEELETSCEARAVTVIVRIPTLDEIGFLILCAALGATALLYRRMR